MSTTDERIAALRAARPRSLFLRASVALVGALVAVCWWAGSFDADDLFSERRRNNVERFLFDDIVPHDPSGHLLPPGEWPGWAAELFARHGREAVVTTLAISVAAIVLAWAAALLASCPAARTLMRADPFVGDGSGPRDRLWRGVAGLLRFVLILLRSVPEYVLTFLMVSLLGISAWPAVMALALHNAGILGKLPADVVENLDGHRLAALRGLGASRAQIAVFGVYPDALSRFLFYVFYRWETCVREATVLGMLGIVSLGRLIGDAQIRRNEDELLFYVLLGPSLVLIGDFVSALARSQVRKAR